MRSNGAGPDNPVEVGRAHGSGRGERAVVLTCRARESVPGRPFGRHGPGVTGKPLGFRRMNRDVSITRWLAPSVPRSGGGG
jgi:hypothetical protein